jgi:hypothetical protein
VQPAGGVGGRRAAGGPEAATRSGIHHRGTVAQRWLPEGCRRNF